MCSYETAFASAVNGIAPLTYVFSVHNVGYILIPPIVLLADPAVRRSPASAQLPFLDSVFWPLHGLPPAGSAAQCTAWQISGNDQGHPQTGGH